MPLDASDSQAGSHGLPCYTPTAVTYHPATKSTPGPNRTGDARWSRSTAHVYRLRKPGWLTNSHTGAKRPVYDTGKRADDLADVSLWAARFAARSTVTENTPGTDRRPGNTPVFSTGTTRQDFGFPMSVCHEWVHAVRFPPSRHLPTAACRLRRTLHLCCAKVPRLVIPLR